MKREDIQNRIKDLMIKGTDINDQIKESNHLIRKNIDFSLIVRYSRSIEFKLLKTCNKELSISEFLIFSGQVLRSDYVDILFGKYYQLTAPNFSAKLNDFSSHQFKIDDLYSNSRIYTIDETPSCKSFVIETKDKFLLIKENWQI